MKQIVALLSVAAVIVVSQSRGASQTATPEDCIRNFYRWYVTNLVAKRDPMKQRSEIRHYATEHLLKQIDKMAKGPNGLDGDYFVDAQDFDPLWAKNIAISEVRIRGDKSTAHVLLNGSKGMQKRLILQLVEEAGAWKVDKVESGGD